MPRSNEAAVASAAAIAEGAPALCYATLTGTIVPVNNPLVLAAVLAFRDAKWLPGPMPDGNGDLIDWSHEFSLAQDDTCQPKNWDTWVTR